MKKYDQLSKCLEKSDTMHLYDDYLQKRYTIDHEDTHFFKKKIWDLIGIPKQPGVYFSDHASFFIHDDLFDITQSTYQDKDISMKIITNEQNKN